MSRTDTFYDLTRVLTLVHSFTGPLDLWKLNPQEESGYLADRLMENFDRRKIAVEVWNAALADGSYKPTFARKSWWKVKKSVFGIGTGDGKNKVGLAGALSDTFFRNFWSGGVIKVRYRNFLLFLGKYQMKAAYWSDSNWVTRFSEMSLRSHRRLSRKL